MKHTLLHIDASARSFTKTQVKHQSISRQLALEFKEAMLHKHGDLEVIYRDLSVSPPSFISEQWIAACFDKTGKVDKSILDESNILISEIEQASIILLSTPMYNYGMPAVLKAWFDQIIRIGKTFSFDLSRGDDPLEPILSGKKMVLVTSCGEAEFSEGERKHHLNHLEPHIKQLSTYLGVSDFYCISSQFQEFDDTRHRDSKHSAHIQLEQLANEII